MRILAILVILHNLDLNQKRSECLPIFTSSYMVEWDVNPAFGLCKVEGAEGDEIVIACASEESNACGSV